jgi:hypothetical protein
MTILMQPLKQNARRIPTSGELRQLRLSMTCDLPRRRPRAWSLPRKLAIVLLFLMAFPAANLLAGNNTASAGSLQQGCRLVSVVDGNTLNLACPGRPAAAHAVMGLQSPPVMDAACVQQAVWGLRAQIALRYRVWQAEALTFVPEPRGNLVLVFADGVPMHRLIAPVPQDLCS